jgi:release factor glutamine methyltransferase
MTEIVPQFIGLLLIESALVLKDVSCTPRLDVELLLGEVLNLNRAELLCQSENTVSLVDNNKFCEMLNARANGVPLAYVIGRKDFWNYSFFVSPYVLIPRPDTELLIEKTLKIIDKKYHKNSYSEHTVNILELGVGSGCILISLTKELQKRGISVKATGIDASHKALEVSGKNSQELNVNSYISLLYSDWFSAVSLENNYDFIITNPPYVEENSTELSKGVNFEPSAALFSGQDGLSDIRKILSLLPLYWKTGSHFFCEFGYKQKSEIEKLIAKQNEFKTARVAFHKDIAGLWRVLEMEKIEN